MSYSYSTTTLYDAPVFQFTRCDNTNTRAAELLGRTQPPFFVTSVSQIGGQTRRPAGAWDSPAGNIYLTAVLKDFNVKHMNKRCKKLAKYLNSLDDKLKILLNENSLMQDASSIADRKKLGGYMYSRDNSANITIFGIGINVNCTLDEHDDRLKSSATTIRTITGNTYNVRELTEHVIKLLLI